VQILSKKYIIGLYPTISKFNLIRIRFKSDPTESNVDWIFKSDY